VVHSTSCSIEFNRYGNAARDTRGKAKEETQAKAIAEPTQNRVRHCSCNQSQRAVLATQQIVGKIKAPKQIKTGANDAYGCDRMMIHSVIVPE
jgi:hypothetical protein